MTQTIIVAIIVLAAVVWAIWSMVRRTGSGGCASCGSGALCPYANKGVCPSESAEEPNVCDEIRDMQEAKAQDRDTTEQ